VSSFIVTHPTFPTYFWDNKIISDSQDNLSKLIKFTIADGIQIDAAFNNSAW
jgi:citrate lyase synthetase